ncbi:MAG: hypothetical protein ACLP0A_03050 [Verrucomicrobiia bacterium]
MFASFSFSNWLNFLAALFTFAGALHYLYLSRRDKSEIKAALWCFVASLLAMAALYFDFGSQRAIDKKMSELDPRNRPVETATATVHFFLRGDNPDRSVLETNCVGMLSFTPRGKELGYVDLMLRSTTVTIVGNERFIDFTLGALWSSNFSTGTNSAQKDIDRIDRCRLALFNDPMLLAGVTGGVAVLTLNSVVQKTFMFPVQKNDAAMIVGFDSPTNAVVNIFR